MAASSLCAALDYRSIHHIAVGGEATGPYHRLTALHAAVGRRQAYNAPPHLNTPPRHWRGYVCGASNQLAWSHVRDLSALSNDSATASVAGCELPAVTLAIRPTVSDIILLDALEEEHDWCDQPANFTLIGFRGLAVCLTRNASKRSSAGLTHAAGLTLAWMAAPEVESAQRHAVPLDALEALWEAHLNSTTVAHATASIISRASNETLRAAVLVSGQVRGLQQRLSAGSQWADFVVRSRPDALAADGIPVEDPERAGLHWGTPQMGVFQNIQMNVISALWHVDVFMYTTWRGGMPGEPTDSSDHSFCRLLDPVRRGAARDNRLHCKVEREPPLDRLDFLDADAWAHFGKQIQHAPRGQTVTPYATIRTHAPPTKVVEYGPAPRMPLTGIAPLGRSLCRSSSCCSSSTVHFAWSRCASPTSSSGDCATAGWCGYGQIRSSDCRCRRSSICTERAS